MVSRFSSSSPSRELVSGVKCFMEWLGEKKTEKRTLVTSLSNGVGGSVQSLIDEGTN